MGTLLTLLGALVVLVPICYMYTASIVLTRLPMLQNRRICLLIAHPDDEAMFFAPTVMALTRPEAGNHVKILCLSTGNADGLGDIRKKELVKSGLTLGLRSEEDVFVVESPDFQDSITTTWDAQKISNLLSSTFVPSPAHGKPSETPTATIDILVTFDSGGVSGHPNHISLFRGARQFVASLTHNRPGWKAPVDLYTLTSVPLVRKYTSILDVLATLVMWFTHVTRATKDRAHPGALLFLADLRPGVSGGLSTAWQAMTTAHKSQMVWFRYGWITLSRYMVVNDLRLEKI